LTSAQQVEARERAGLPPGFRHEMLSVQLAELSSELPDDEHERALLLHLIAAHHGYARPHFPPDRAIDPARPQSEADTAAVETMRRYARLQRRYGRWGLAYLESLLRAADWVASAEPTRTAPPESAQEATS